MSDVFTHGLRANKDIIAALQAANDALVIANNAASVIYHQIGSYVFAALANTAVVEPNAIVAGSNLRMAGGLCSAQNNNTKAWNISHISTIALPGTWRCMGYISINGNSITAQSASLWVRVA